MAIDLMEPDELNIDNALSSFALDSDHVGRLRGLISELFDLAKDIHGYIKDTQSEESKANMPALPSAVGIAIAGVPWAMALKLIAVTDEDDTAEEVAAVAWEISSLIASEMYTADINLIEDEMEEDMESDDE